MILLKRKGFLRTLGNPLRAPVLHCVFKVLFLFAKTSFSVVGKDSACPLTMIGRPHLFLCKDSLLEAALLLNENRAAVMVTLLLI